MTRIFGIDLGTTNSLIAVMEGESPRAIPDPQSGNPLLPSVVAIAPDGRVRVGEAALDAGLDGADCGVVLRSIKRYMGLGGGEVAVEDRVRHAFGDFSGPVVRFRAGGRLWSPPELSAEILRAIKQRAETALGGEKVERAVITVPAYFNDGQRQATKDAGRLAGLEVVRLVNEPTAASLAYGLERRAEGRVAVYDLGGGTFDISILNIKGGVFEVLATNGDTHLGGDDIDRVIVEFVLEGLPEAVRSERRTWNRARWLAEESKKRLSFDVETEIALEIPEGAARKRLTREVLERMAAPLVERTVQCCARALKDANLTPDQIDAVVLVGGATRMPLVRRRVEETFGRPPLCSLDPDQVVALGAAVQAGVLMGARRDMLLLDVVPLSLGIETAGGVMERIIHRNTTIPTSISEMFTTAVDNQTHVDIHVLQGERELARDCRSLARFKLGPLEPQAAGYPKIAVTFLIDANGILNVTARDERTGREHSVDVRPSYGLTDEEVERMLEEALDLGEQDLEARLLATARNEAEQILAALSRQIGEWGALAGPQERAAIEETVKRLEAARAGADRELISKLVEQLNRLTTPFAERIMDAAIKRALEKKSIEELS